MVGQAHRDITVVKCDFERGKAVWGSAWWDIPNLRFSFIRITYHSGIHQILGCTQTIGLIWNGSLSCLNALPERKFSTKCVNSEDGLIQSRSEPPRFDSNLEKKGNKARKNEVKS